MGAAFLHVSYNFKMLVIKYINTSYKISSQDIVNMVILMLYNSKKKYL